MVAAWSKKPYGRWMPMVISMECATSYAVGWCGLCAGRVTPHRAPCLGDGHPTHRAPSRSGVLARLARHVFRVPRVVARLHDPRHAEVYQRLGIQAITPHILYAALAAGSHKNALYRLHPQPVNSLKVTAVVGEEGKILM